MPECQNCGAHVTRQFVRVSWPEDVSNPPACPNCPDMTNATDQPGYRKKRNQ